MADRKVTVWNNDGYQEILRTRVDDTDPGDRLVVDGGGGTTFDTNIGFFSTTPVVQQTGTTLNQTHPCLLYTSPSPRDRTRSRMPSSA